MTAKGMGFGLLFCAAQLFCPAASACTVTTTPVSFGGYDVFAATPADSVGVITVDCAVNMFVTVALSGSGVTGSFNPRQMNSLIFNDSLRYNLYTDATYSVIWGDGTGGTNTIRRRINEKKARIFTVYGRIPPLQDVSAGPYADSVVITVIF